MPSQKPTRPLRARLAGAALALTVGLAAAGPLLSCPPARAEKPDHPKRPSRGDICAETPPFVAMDMLAVPIIRDGEVDGILNVKPCFAASEDQAEAVTAKLPLLQDYYVRKLHLYASRRVNPERPLDLRAIRVLLQDGADQVLGGHIPVLITFAAMRRIG
jgi:hypothetical protein